MDVITDFAANSDKLSFSTAAVLRAADATALSAGANARHAYGVAARAFSSVWKLPR
jgi:hypothetical protein